MVDMTALAAMATSLRAAVEITKAMKDVRDANILQTKVFELTREILAAQTSALEANIAQSALLEKVRDLETQIARLEAWSREKDRYQLTEVATGVFAYAIKPKAKGTEPFHLLCPRCYEDSKKSILQFTQNIHRGTNVHVCPRCKSEFGVRRGTPLEPAPG